MCTVTIVPMGERSGGIRMACNRDELRTRPLALPPQRRTAGNRQFLAPIDPVSDGTWVAANDAGLLMTLLNANPAKDDQNRQNRHPSNLQSRGSIIPSLMGCSDTPSAIERIQSVDVLRYPPFRLIMVDVEQLVDTRSDGRTLNVRSSPLGNCPWMFASSGLGDHLVIPPRQELFDEMFRGMDEASWLAAQEEYHRHQWPDRKELSVCMSRPDARTVSCTTITLDVREVRMKYHPGPPNESVEDVALSCPLRGGLL